MVLGWRPWRCVQVFWLSPCLGVTGALKPSLVKDYAHKMPEAPLLSHTSVALLSCS